MSPPTHKYKQVFIEKWHAGQYDQMTILDQSEYVILINIMTVVIIFG